MSDRIDAYLERQNFEAQIRDVTLHFNPPRGECLLAMRGARPVGTLMPKDVGGGICEMNRMFVRAEARGMGAGRALVETLKRRAAEMGFHEMRLSALPRHHEALALYRSCGFAPYESGEDAAAHAVHMKIALAAG
jgi:GNAT superfamily N-acetyltransferase